MFKLVHYETQLASGQLVSYWNAFLLLIARRCRPKYVVSQLFFSTSAGLRKQNLILNDRVVNASVLHRRFVWSHLRHTNVLDLLFTLFQNTLDSGVLIVHGTITHAQNSCHFRFTVRDAELSFSVSFNVVHIFLMVSTFPINLQCSVDAVVLYAFYTDNNQNG